MRREGAGNSQPLYLTPAQICDILCPVCHIWCQKAVIQSFVPPAPLGLSAEHKSERSPVSRGSSSLKYTTTFPSSGVPILCLRVQVTDAVIKVQGGIHEVFSWQPVSGLVQPWPRRKQPNEYQLGNSAVGTLLKLVHAHNYTQHTHTPPHRPVIGNGHVER